MRLFLELPIRGHLTTRKNDGEIGIEIEYELAERAQPDFDDLHTSGYWTTTHDHSLRNAGYESLFRAPYNRRLTTDAISIWEKFRKRLKFINTYRTSVHIHFNFQNNTGMEVMNFATAYWLFENTLLRYCGETREGNLFCLRLKDAEWPILSLIKDYERENNSPSQIITDDCRYSSLNFAALRKFGSLEVRAMKGIYTEAELTEWLEILLSLKDAASKFKNPKEIIDTFINLPKREFVLKFFPIKYWLLLRKADPDWEKSLESNFILLNVLATRIEETLAKPKKKEPEVDLTQLRSRPLINDLLLNNPRSPLETFTIDTATGTSAPITNEIISRLAQESTESASIIIGLRDELNLDLIRDDLGEENV